MPDFFGPEFEKYVEERSKAVEQDIGDPMVIGYFIDNELPWGPDHRNMPELFDGYVALPADAPGKRKLVEFMQGRYGAVDAFNKVWKPKLTDWSALWDTSKLRHRNKKLAKADREAFTLMVARRYFKVTTDTIRAIDPDRLVLGCRFMPYTVPKAVVQACGEYCDVISINFYEQLWGAKLYFWWKGSSIDRMPQGLDLSPFYKTGRKPLMVTEFTSRLKAKGQNTYPPPYAIQPVVKTEAERVARYEKQVMSWLPQPWFVGSHWFEHADQPKEGRGDGENSIFGLVTIQDEPYKEFVQGVTAVHQKATQAHAASTVDNLE
jgi:agarase